MDLKQLIKELSPSLLDELENELIISKSSKSIILLNDLKLNKPELEIQKKLNLTPSAFYTLKSRLNNKIQKFIAEEIIKNVNGKPNEIFVLINHIDKLLYFYPRNMAISFLLMMEKKCLQAENFMCLRYIYKGLKQIHFYSPKYYDYLKLYQDAVSSEDIIEQSEDIVLAFNSQLGRYFLDNKEYRIELLNAYINRLAENYSINKSKYLLLFKNILEIQYYLNVEKNKSIDKNNSVFKLLNETFDLVQNEHENPKVEHYAYWINVLFFKYYVLIQSYKKAQKKYELLLKNKLVYLNRYFFVSNFLFSEIEYRLNFQEEGNPSFKVIDFNADFTKENAENFISFKVFHALNLFYDENYKQAYMVVRDLYLEIKLNNYSEFKTEIAIFEILLEIILKKTDIAKNHLRGVIRKSNIKDTKSNIIKLYIKLFNAALPDSKKNKNELIENIYSEIAMQQSRFFTNKIKEESVSFGYKILPLIKISDKILSFIVER